MSKTEKWIDVPSVPGLMVSDFGRVMVRPYQKHLPQGGQRTYGGKPTHGVWTNNRYKFVYRRKNYKVHRLVCEAFNGPPREGDVCMHLDENPANNSPDNLSWGTQKENLNAPGFIEYCKNRVGDNSPVIKGKRKQ